MSWFFRLIFGRNVWLSLWPKRRGKLGGSVGFRWRF